MINTYEKKSTHAVSCLISTPLGDMIAVADAQGLYVLDFVGNRNGDRKIVQLQKKLNAVIESGRNAILELITKELQEYFAGGLQDFTTPFYLQGSAFQLKAWDYLTTVPYGTVATYAQEAVAIGNAQAHRAVGNANGKNNLAIIVPCHRIIGSGGKLCGYAGGIDRKEWLIAHEGKNPICPLQ
jgi:AraC family transcriptional regulator, regulatory protein of adaptative response / methylated-DNA-[protein]-cysteine methyltransferase